MAILLLLATVRPVLTEGSLAWGLALAALVIGLLDAGLVEEEAEAEMLLSAMRMV